MSLAEAARQPRLLNFPESLVVSGYLCYYAAKGEVMYQVEITHNQGLNFTAKAGEGEFVIDAKGKEFGPLDAFLAALGSCIGVYIRKYAEGTKLDLSNFKVKVSAELSKESPIYFRQVFVTIDLKACQLDERRQKALAEFIKNCPVHNTIKGSPQVEFKISSRLSSRPGALPVKECE